MRKNTTTVLFVALLLLCSATASFSSSYYTQGEKSYDGTGKFYMGREISDVIGGHGAIEWLERREREDEEKPQLVIDALNLKPTDAVADIGAGSGYFTFRISPMVSKGKVYAVEIGQVMIDFIDKKKADLGLNNVETILGTVEDTRLPEGAVDVALLVDAYHEFSHPREMMESLYKALKPGGRVFLVEYKGEDPQIPIKPLHKMTVEQVKKELSEVGFVWIKTYNTLPFQHIIELRKE